VVSKTRLFSSHYTATGFDKQNVNIPLCVLTFTIVFALIKATII
jgi:hypothetical protein